MIGPDEEQYMRERAYVPEHAVGLMTAISGGEPFLVEDCLVVAKGDWLALVGYPFACGPSGTAPIAVERIRSRFRPRRLRFIGPFLPESFRGIPAEYDFYYRIDLDGYTPPARLRHAAAAAAEELTVERAAVMTGSHHSLIAEFLEQQPLTPRIRELFRSTPEWLPRASTLVLLSAWDRKGNLAAFHVVDRAPAHFSSSILACRSRKAGTPHASDLLFLHLIELAREERKAWINLGLGVNEGIRRFKDKWGGKPFLAYAYCEPGEERPAWLTCLQHLVSRS